MALTNLQNVEKYFRIYLIITTYTIYTHIHKY